MMNEKRKLKSIIYRYDNMQTEYVDSVSEISATNFISFDWFYAALTKLKFFMKGN
tara:strand:- start:149 stop:313 length:165 start_codon:yes stop_codon:yes gene_type:complete